MRAKIVCVFPLRQFAETEPIQAQGQNPAFREFTYRRDGTLIDTKTWYLPNLNKPSDWELEYDFGSEWQSNKLDLASLTKLYSQIGAQPPVRNGWEKNYSVSHVENGPMTPKAFAATSCATGNEHVEDFRKCFCSAAPDSAICTGAASSTSISRSPLR